MLHCPEELQGLLWLSALFISTDHSIICDKSGTTPGPCITSKSYRAWSGFLPCYRIPSTSSKDRPGFLCFLQSLIMPVYVISAGTMHRCSITSKNSRACFAFLPFPQALNTMLYVKTSSMSFAHCINWECGNDFSTCSLPQTLSTARYVTTFGVVLSRYIIWKSLKAFPHLLSTARTEHISACDNIRLELCTLHLLVEAQCIVHLLASA